jgi:hypothetical protein
MKKNQITTTTKKKQMSEVSEPGGESFLKISN